MRRSTSWRRRPSGSPRTTAHASSPPKIAPAIAVPTASWIDSTNASTNVSSVNSREMLSRVELARRRRERADGDDQRREDQEEPDVRVERDEGEVVPRPPQATRAGPAVGGAGSVDPATPAWLAGVSVTRRTRFEVLGYLMVMNFQFSVRYVGRGRRPAPGVSCTGGRRRRVDRGERGLVDGPGLQHGRQDRPGEPLQPGVLAGSEKMYSIQQRAAAGCGASLLIAEL